jgi:hypothetical protein
MNGGAFSLLTELAAKAAPRLRITATFSCCPALDYLSIHAEVFDLGARPKGDSQPPEFIEHLSLRIHGYGKLLISLIYLSRRHSFNAH